MVFEQYQKSRTQFVQTIAELSTRAVNIETLQAAGVMQLLRPLLLDIVPTVQQTAALALGRLANYSDDLAEAVVRSDILPQLVYSLAEVGFKLLASYSKQTFTGTSLKPSESKIDFIRRRHHLFSVPWQNTLPNLLKVWSIVVLWKPWFHASKNSTRV